MAIQLLMSVVEPYLRTLKSSETRRVEAWLPVLQVLLNARYGSKITQEPDGGNDVVFVAAAAEAIERRLDRRGMVLQENIGPAGARYDPRATLSTWFLPEELDQMDELTGLGGIRSHRTPAPDAVRFVNRADGWPITEDESCEGDLLIGGV